MSFNRSKAIEYARQYWNDYNPNFESYANDCTNFVSQCWNYIMGPLSRPRSKILRVAVSRIILSSEASKVKLVGNLVA